MWCSSYCTPLQLPFRQIRLERGGGKGFQLPYKREVSNPIRPAKRPRTTTERSEHEEEGTHREDRREGRRAKERGTEALRSLRGSSDRGAQGWRRGPDHGLREVLR